MVQFKGTLSINVDKKRMVIEVFAFHAVDSLRVQIKGFTVLYYLSWFA